jgi:hypothetical protein
MILERISHVASTEQNEEHAPSLATVAAAPMVERAFRLLDLDLAQIYTRRAGLRHFVLPAMRRLATSTGETICLGRIEPQGVRIIECVVDEEEQVGLHIAARRGMRIPLLAGAAGACVLASWPLAQREEYVYTHPLPHFTKPSITEPQLFLARVKEVVRTGIALDHEEYLDGVNAVATPIYGTGGAEWLPCSGLLALPRVLRSAFWSVLPSNCLAKPWQFHRRWAQEASIP